MHHPDERQRILREARVSARLSHENVVRVYDVGESDGAVFIVMAVRNDGRLTDYVLVVDTGNATGGLFWKNRGTAPSRASSRRRPDRGYGASASTSSATSSAAMTSGIRGASLRRAFAGNRSSTSPAACSIRSGPTNSSP